jgi:hypothetical protein
MVNNNSVKRRQNKKNNKKGFGSSTSALNIELSHLLAGDLVFDGPPGFREFILEIAGGEEALREMMRSSCPICCECGVRESDI